MLGWLIIPSGSGLAPVALLHRHLKTVHLYQKTAGTVRHLTTKKQRREIEILSTAETHTGEFIGKTPKVEKLHLHRYTLYEYIDVIRLD